LFVRVKNLRRAERYQFAYGGSNLRLAASGFGLR
jgi:hypothetical protein